VALDKSEGSVKGISILGGAGAPGKFILMKIGVLFLGVLKDLVGRSGETVDLPEGARVRDVLFYYAREAPRSWLPYPYDPL